MPSFNPRTPCGVRQPLVQYLTINEGFNPRTPCGVRLQSSTGQSPDNKFQSTHSLRSATIGNWPGSLISQVSIHALLAECDETTLRDVIWQVGFNPRTPCGVRPATGRACAIVSAFQSTHSLRSATDIFRGTGDGTKVSIHALLAECDSLGRFARAGGPCFNPRTPCGVRHNENEN